MRHVSGPARRRPRRRRGAGRGRACAGPSARRALAAEARSTASSRSRSARGGSSVSSAADAVQERRLSSDADGLRLAERRRRRPRRRRSAASAARIVASRSPRFAPRPTYARVTAARARDADRRRRGRPAAPPACARGRRRARRGKRRVELVGDRGGERLEQRELRARRDLAHDARDLAVVDRSRRSSSAPARRTSSPTSKRNLAVRALLLVHAVVPEEKEVVDSTVITRSPRARRAPRRLGTSWTRRIDAPRSNAATARRATPATEPCVAAGSPRILPERALAREPDEHRPAERRRARRGGAAARGSARRSCRSRSRDRGRSAPPGFPARRRTRAAPRGTPPPRRRRRRSAGRLHRARLALHVHQAEIAPASATTPASSGSPRSAVTSLTSSAPSSSARRATSAFEVSIETGTPASPSRTGTTRRSSSSSATPAATGRVDSPPTSTIAAPSADHPPRLRRPPSGSRWTPPSEKLVRRRR